MSITTQPHLSHPSANLKFRTDAEEVEMHQRCVAEAGRLNAAREIIQQLRRDEDALIEAAKAKLREIWITADSDALTEGLVEAESVLERRRAAKSDDYAFPVLDALKELPAPAAIDEEFEEAVR